MPTPFLSIIIPAYNEEQRLPETLEKVFAFLSAQTYTAEVIVVENGSTDRTAEFVLQFCDDYENLTLIQEKNSGKGRAVRAGMLAAKGQYRFMCDADLSMPIKELNRFLPPESGGFDIVIGSREAPGAIRYEEPAYRHFGGRAVNTMIRLLALPGFHDTQCGFKCFRAKAAEDLFGYQTLSGWSFDIEILYIARQRGYKIKELPIPWHFDAHSKLNVIGDTFKMAVDILLVRRNARMGKYNGTEKV